MLLPMIIQVTRTVPGFVDGFEKSVQLRVLAGSECHRYCAAVAKGLGLMKVRLQAKIPHQTFKFVRVN